jgi:hypothetical protein
MSEVDLSTTPTIPNPKPGFSKNVQSEKEKLKAEYFSYCFMISCQIHKSKFILTNMSQSELLFEPSSLVKFCTKMARRSISSLLQNEY